MSAMSLKGRKRPNAQRSSLNIQFRIALRFGGGGGNLTRVSRICRPQPYHLATPPLAEVEGNARLNSVNVPKCNDCRIEKARCRLHPCPALKLRPVIVGARSRCPI